jgi:hypothetical protein
MTIGVIVGHAGAKPVFVKICPHCDGGTAADRANRGTTKGAEK